MYFPVSQQHDNLHFFSLINFKRQEKKSVRELFTVAIMEMLRFVLWMLLSITCNQKTTVLKVIFHLIICLKILIVGKLLWYMRIKTFDKNRCVAIAPSCDIAPSCSLFSCNLMSKSIMVRSRLVT